MIAPLTFTETDEIIATNVTFEDYLELYAEQFCEWVDGKVIRMSPIHIQHDALSRYGATLFEACFELKPIGRIFQAPFVMKLPGDTHGREPDLQIVLNVHSERIKTTFIDGPADICIEIVSFESTSRDYGDKFSEYESGGIAEYWILDPIRKQSRFLRLNEDKRYQQILEDSDGNYQTPLLPGFTLHVPTLWREKLPGPAAAARAVAKMLE